MSEYWKTHDELQSKIKKEQEKNKRLVEALKYIEGHGTPGVNDTHKTWVSCFLSMSRKAEQALNDNKEK